MTIINYSFDFVNNYILKNNHLLIKDKTILSKFKTIVENNYFNPKKYVKKFNYTNWRNAFKKEDEATKNMDDIVYEKINLLLNKISKKTFDILSQKIIELIDNNEKYLKYTIYLLFKLATTQHLLTNVYSELCLLLEKKYTTNKINIKEIILNECKSNYKNYNKSIELIKKNKTIEDTDYDILCKINKSKKKLIGIFHFVGNLYQKKLIVDIVIYKYLELLYQNLNDDTIDIDIREQYVSCLKELITNTGEDLKIHDSNKFNKDVLKVIEIFMKDTKFNNREKFMFMDVMDLF